MKNILRYILRYILTLAILLAAVACASSPGPSSSSEAAKYLGVFEPGAPSFYQPIDHFAQLANLEPNLVSYYSGWPEKFRSSFAEQAHARGATVVVQINPTNVSMAAIIAGRYDAYIASYAQVVHAFKYRVVISFGHEMNGSWYSWAWKHTPPALWIAAWRHVVDVFRGVGAANVTWMWTITTNAPSTGPIQDWWPGAAYVDWVGVDGYYYFKTSTYQTVFDPTISAVRRLTNKPILLSEVGIGQVSGQARNIPGLFAGVRRDHLLGFSWFDVRQYGSLYAQDWRIEDDPAGIRAFRQAIVRAQVTRR